MLSWGSSVYSRLGLWGFSEFLNLDVLGLLFVCLFVFPQKGKFFPLFLQILSQPDHFSFHVSTTVAQ